MLPGLISVFFFARLAVIVVYAAQVSLPHVRQLLPRRRTFRNALWGFLWVVGKSGEIKSTPPADKPAAPHAPGLFCRNQQHTSVFRMAGLMAGIADNLLQVIDFIDVMAEAKEVQASHARCLRGRREMIASYCL
ncbi:MULTISPECIES: hypothetical protein [unclassified Paracoccus (in: a-proteobacteria)]|uniref:hypothetical protein n=1 Tax=unclassified Paracoccus (in: a-proteobacteria) TaxID=2688777 RepID=UPI0012B3B502|nr:MULTISPECIES: hypothetical protein [unclassified Paracoccus (in: a-proteobacteria)]UXU74209.1 hypothetical protein GB879_009845 [Paracoccus sp. SMMA_5]UXU80097.1 hypothetical protein GB880_009815 [Paracoccus sp. SMMA_5_TC]